MLTMIGCDCLQSDNSHLNLTTLNGTLLSFKYLLCILILSEIFFLIYENVGVSVGVSVATEIRRFNVLFVGMFIRLTSEAHESTTD